MQGRQGNPRMYTAVSQYDEYGYRMRIQFLLHRFTGYHTFFRKKPVDFRETQ